MTKPRFSAAIFDLDGTITDTPMLHMATFNEVLKPYDIEIAKEQWMHVYEGTGSTFIFGDILAKNGLAGRVSIDELRNKRRSLFKELAMQQLVPIRGFGKFFDELKAMNVDHIVATNAEDSTLNLCLQILKLEDVPHVNAAAVGERLKPDPAVYLVACEQLGKEPNECVVFEDSTSGVLAAKRAGCYCVALLTTNTREALEEAGADLVIADYTKLAPGLLFTKK
ncbi:HAD family phosphatase [Candidatus Woesearchaeota archaeon]|nr:HAD family phosphatase [Candidatus Woesearchaeota archaeon]